MLVSYYENYSTHMIHCQLFFDNGCFNYVSQYDTYMCHTVIHNKKKKTLKNRIK